MKGLKKTVFALFGVAILALSMHVSAYADDMTEEEFYEEISGTLHNGAKFILKGSELTVEGEGLLTEISGYTNENIKVFEPEDITSVKVKGFTEIDLAFYNFKSLTKVELPNGLTKISRAFCFCKSLETVSIPESVTFIGEHTFSSSGIKSVIIPDNVTEIGHMAFMDCDDLKKITMNANLKTIGYCAFEHCDNLESIDLNDGLETIEKEVFAGCSKLKELIIPDSVTRIDSLDIYSCTTLQTLSIPISCGCTDCGTLPPGLTKLVFTKGTGEYTLKLESEDLCKNYENSDGSEVKEFETIFEEGITEIPEGFMDCSSNMHLVKITIPSTMTKIGGSAFGFIDDLREVVFTEGKGTRTLSFGGNIFWGAQNLKTLSFPKDINRISGADFAWNTFITDVYFYNPRFLVKRSAFSFDFPEYTKLHAYPYDYDKNDDISIKSFVKSSSNTRHYKFVPLKNEPVQKKILVKSITLSPNNIIRYEEDVRAGRNTERVNVFINPVNAIDQGFAVSYVNTSGNPVSGANKGAYDDVLEVDTMYISLTGEPGEAVVTVEALDNSGVKAQCRVLVTKRYESPQITLKADEKGTDVSMLPGETRRLNVSDVGQFIFGVKWSLSDENPKGCVTVKNGVVTANKLKKGCTEGKAKVTASYGSSSVTFNVTVKGDEPESTVITDGKKKIKIAAPKIANLTAGVKKPVKISIPKELKEASNTLTCKVLDEGVCTVGVPDRSNPSSALCEITPVNAGATWIIWTMENGKGESTQTATKVVVKKPISEIDISENGVSEIALTPGDGVRLVVNETEDNTESKDLTFSVKGKGIKVSKSGYISADSPNGFGTVTVKCGKVSDTINVRVSDERDYIVLNKSSAIIKIPKSGMVKPSTLSLSVAVPKKDKPTVSWDIKESEHTGISVSENGIVSVDSTAVPGCYTITATCVTGDPAYTASCEIIVQ